MQCLFSKRNIYFFVQSLQDEQIPELKTRAKLDSLDLSVYISESIRKAVKYQQIPFFGNVDNGVIKD